MRILLLHNLVQIISALHRLEPPDGSIIHGAGQTNQDFSAIYGFNNYSNYLNNTTRPVIFMEYAGLTDLTQDWFDQFNSLLNSYGSDQYLIPQLGLAFNGICQQIADGEYDKYIQILVNGVASTQRPWFIRLGYELYVEIIFNQYLSSSF